MFLWKALFAEAVMQKRIGWMSLVIWLATGGGALAAPGWMLGDLVGAVVIAGDGKAVGEIADLYADRAGQVRAVEVRTEEETLQVPWPSLHFDRSGHVVRLSGGFLRQDAPPPGLASLVRSMGSPVSFTAGVPYGRVAAVRIGAAGEVEEVMVKPAAPTLQPYRLAWTALDFYSLPHTAPEVAETPR